MPDPSSVRSRKMSGWMVPKTEIDGPGNAVSAGPACVPADLSTNPTHIAAINRNHATPPSNQEVPHSLPTSPGVTASVNVRPRREREQARRLRQKSFGAMGLR